MNTGIDIYRLLARKNLTVSRRDCSRYFLGMNASYLAQRGNKALTERALINLFRRLWAEGRYLLALRVAWAVLWGERP